MGKVDAKHDALARRELSLRPSSCQSTLGKGEIEGFLDAVRRQDLLTIRKLLDNGVSANTADEMGSTALIHAAAVGAAASIDVLLENGADPSRRNKYRESPLSVALSRQHTELVSSLSGHREDVLHALRLLLDIGAAVNVFEPLYPILDPLLVDALRTGRLALVLGDEADTSVLVNGDPTCVGGVYTKEPENILMFAFSRVPQRVNRLYVSTKPEFIDFLLRHAQHASRPGLKLLFFEDPRKPATTHHVAAPSLAPRPALVEIEPNDWCNLRCIMCHVSFMRNHVPARLPSDILKKIDLRGTAMIQLGAAFEPMLHKDFAEFVSKAKGTPLYITSNATLLTPEIAAALRDHGDVTINISIDGGSKEVYEAIRRGGRFHDMRQRLAVLAAGRDRSKLRIWFGCTVMKSNLDHLLEVVSIAEDIGVDTVSFRSIFVRELALLDKALDGERARLIEALDDVARYIIKARLRVTGSTPHFAYTSLRQLHPNNFIGDAVLSDNPEARPLVNRYALLQLGRQYRANRCASPERLVRVEANGVVTTCKGYVIGNIHERPLDEIWNGAPATLVRSVVNNQPVVCNNCDHYRFCLNTSSRESLQMSSISGALKYDGDLDTGDSTRQNTAARVLYDCFSDHRVADLMRAVRADRADWAEIILATGLDPETPDAEGRTALELCEAVGAGRVRRLLLDYGVGK